MYKFEVSGERGSRSNVAGTLEADQHFLMT